MGGTAFGFHGIRHLYVFHESIYDQQKFMTGTKLYQIAFQGIIGSGYLNLIPRRYSHIFYWEIIH